MLNLKIQDCFVLKTEANQNKRRVFQITEVACSFIQPSIETYVIKELVSIDDSIASVPKYIYKDKQVFTVTLQELDENFLYLSADGELIPVDKYNEQKKVIMSFGCTSGLSVPYKK